MAEAAGAGARSAVLYGLAVASLLLLLFLLPLPFQEGLVYRPERIPAGEFWTLLTTHFVHQSRFHLGLNIATWAVVCAFVAPVISSWPRAMGVLFVIAVASTLLAYACWPDPRGFVGFSGAIYGFLAYGSLRGTLRSARRGLYGAVLVALLLKITFEHLQGASVWDSHPTVGLGGELSPIEVRLHSAGVAGGLGLGALAIFKDRLFS